MAVVGRLVGTFEPALVMVTIAQANNASAATTTTPPIQPAGTAAGMNGTATIHCRASPASTASAHAIGGRTMTLAVSAVSFMADPLADDLPPPASSCGSERMSRRASRNAGAGPCVAFAGEYGKEPPCR